ncbi:hypothetical protein MVEN_00082800 [Mycena venus]|uniref:Myb/SANT-like domain-containing protein n=1 Tax=Mycena venus TaxID=2733690 RepID=A0A8H6Z4L4_9AGAR|nr:hypothetical protein MVEN_00082800 [Mycena venus]
MVPVKDQVKIISKMNNLKEIFEIYLFVEKFSGTGWDDDEKHAVNTKEYIEDFVKTHGKKFARCFKKACPFYAELDELYEGLRNRATGDHVVHLPQKCRRKSQKENPSQPESSTAATKAALSVPADDSVTHNEDRTPMATMNGTLDESITTNDEQSGAGSGARLYDDELRLSPAKLSSKRIRAESNDDDAPDAADPKGKRRHHKSDSSNGSTARRNAEAGSQLARSVENLSAAILKPITTTEDMSHVDNIMQILDDSTLLPPDPRGRLFNIVVTALTSSHTRARIFILATDTSRRKAIIAGILEDARVEVPDDY